MALINIRLLGCVSWLPAGYSMLTGPTRRCEDIARVWERNRRLLRFVLPGNVPYRCIRSVATIERIRHSLRNMPYPIRKTSTPPPLQKKDRHTHKKKRKGKKCRGKKKITFPAFAGAFHCGNAGCFLEDLI